MEKVTIIEVNEEGLEEALKQAIGQDKDLDTIVAQIAKQIRNRGIDCLLEDGRDAVIRTKAHLQGHITAAKNHLEHLPTCESCASRTDLTQTVETIKAKAEAALEALKAFEEAEIELEKFAKN